MSKPPLPGFFWDEEKQRYFKIGQSKHETPTSAKYTWDNVEKRKRNDDELDVAKYTGDYSFVDVPDMTVLRASETEGQCVTSVTGACTGHHYIDLLSPTDLIRPNTDDDEYRYSPHNFGCITDGFEDYDRVALNPFIRHPRYFDGRLEIEHGSFHLQHPGAAVSVGENVFIINMLDSIRGRGAEPRFRVQSEILSLAWLSESLIAVGCRSGSIYVFYTGSMRRVFSFRHVDLDHKPAAAAALRRADGSGLRLVVAGFPNAVALYDIRLRRSNQQPLLVHYRDYVNAADPDVTMDVAGDASKGQPGLVAVTSGNRFVNIYAMMSGELLRRVDFKVVMADPSLRILGHAEGRSRRIRMKSLKFVDMEQDAEDWKGDSVWSEEWTHDCGEETECDRKSVRRYGPEETWEGADEDERMYDGGVGTVGRRFGSGRLLAGCDKGIIEIAW
ncbi:hypothetical protein BDY21DRAFT_368356 [Lineolata rhizophorae]|uniref:WD40-repeat-containing domain protein n=1 Tax=Lineolata rhizophorae TaxID=578093 RepID=A0A6A6PE75_9PEZI|nr:hypothetical protein BDY21DRAFT_368356 [Lineolata rhizophorae]